MFYFFSGSYLSYILSCCNAFTCFHAVSESLLFTHTCPVTEFAVASHLNTANSCCHHVFLRHFRFQKCLPVYSNSESARFYIYSSFFSSPCPAWRLCSKCTSSTEIIPRPLIRFQRPDHEIILRSQIDLPIVHRCITPRSINSLVGSLFNDLSLFLQIRKPFSGHKIILHTVLLACPDRSGRIRHHRPDLRQPLSQYLIDRVLPGRALSHHVKYMSHLPIIPFQPVFSHAFHRIYKSDFSLFLMANVRTC